MKTTPTIPYDYATWQHCITVECGITLTPAFIRERLRILSDPREYESQRFAEVHGKDHLQAVLGWFARAGKEMQVAVS